MTCPQKNGPGKYLSWIDLRCYSGHKRCWKGWKASKELGQAVYRGYPKMGGPFFFRPQFASVALPCPMGLRPGAGGFAPARFHHHIPHTTVSSPPAVRPSARYGSSLLVSNLDRQSSPQYAHTHTESIVVDYSENGRIKAVLEKYL